MVGPPPGNAPPAAGTGRARSEHESGHRRPRTGTGLPMNPTAANTGPAPAPLIRQRIRSVPVPARSGPVDGSRGRRARPRQPPPADRSPSRRHPRAGRGHAGDPGESRECHGDAPARGESRARPRVRPRPCDPPSGCCRPASRPDATRPATTSRAGRWSSSASATAARWSWSPARPSSWASDGRIPEDGPAHTVRLSTYYIDQYEVTNRQFRTFLEETHYLGQPPGKWLTDEKLRALPDNAPAVFVNYHDAEAYAIWALKRLPTEAQWELAARSVDGRRYPWGDQPVRWVRDRASSARSIP